MVNVSKGIILNNKDKFIIYKNKLQSTGTIEVSKIIVDIL